jgi:hypothetical protein
LRGAADPVVCWVRTVYPQLFLNNPTRAVQRGLVASGPTFFLSLEVNGRVRPIQWLGEAGWIGCVGLQVLLEPKEPVTPQVEQKLPNQSKP